MARPRRLSDADAAYAAAAWASGETQKGIAQTFGYKNAGAINHVIAEFVNKYTGERIGAAWEYSGYNKRLAMIPAALVAFRATL